MARQLPVLNSASVTQSLPTRKADVRQGIWIEMVTIVWMLVEASIAITVGFTAHSVSLQGFGIDSIVELIAGSADVVAARVANLIELHRQRIGSVIPTAPQSVWRGDTVGGRPR